MEHLFRDPKPFTSFRLPTVRLEVGIDKSLRNTYCVLTYTNILDYKSTADDDLNDVDTTKTGEDGFVAHRLHHNHFKISLRRWLGMETLRRKIMHEYHR